MVQGQGAQRVEVEDAIRQRPAGGQRRRRRLSLGGWQRRREGLWGGYGGSERCSGRGCGEVLPGSPSGARTSIGGNKVLRESRMQAAERPAAEELPCEQQEKQSQI